MVSKGNGQMEDEYNPGDPLFWGCNRQQVAPDDYTYGNYPCIEGDVYV
jgi:hypothetical protein